MKVRKGDMITNSKPFAYVLMSRMRGKRCDACLVSSSLLKRCTHCGFAFYCNRACQKESWPDHKLECQSLKKVHPRIPPDYVMLMARIIRKLKRGGDRESEVIGNVSRSFHSLMSHMDQIKVDKHRIEVFQTAYFVLSQYLDTTELPSAEIAMEILGKIYINAITILDEQQPIGTGVYLGPSGLDHSCTPNVAVVFEGPSILLRSLEDANEFNIKKLFINYIDVMEVTVNRQRQLQERFYFTCQCQICTDNQLDDLMHSIRCPSKNCSNPIIPNKDKHCRDCGSSISKDCVEQAEKLMKNYEETANTVEKLKKVDQLDSALCILMTQIESMAPLLHKLNVYYVRTSDEIFDICITLRYFEQALPYGVNTLEAFRKYYGQGQAACGHQLARVGKLQFNMDLIDEAGKHLLEADEILSFLYGESHPVYRTFNDLLVQYKACMSF